MLKSMPINVKIKVLKKYCVVKNPPYWDESSVITIAISSYRFLYTAYGIAHNVSKLPPTPIPKFTSITKNPNSLTPKCSLKFWGKHGKDLLVE